MAMRRPPDLLLRGAFNSTRATRSATGYLYGDSRRADVYTTGWRYSHVRSPPLAEAATPPEVVAQYAGAYATGMIYNKKCI